MAEVMIPWWEFGYRIATDVEFNRQGTQDSFEENKHPRGQPENAGEFAPAGGVAAAPDPKRFGQPMSRDMHEYMHEAKNRGDSAEEIAKKTGFRVDTVEKALAEKPAPLPPKPKKVKPTGPVTFSNTDRAVLTGPDGEQSVISPGSTLYHTTNANFTNFANRTTWFTPFKDEAAGYHENFQHDRGKATTFQVKWKGGKIASVDDTRKAAAQVWPDEPMIYSMFDPVVNEFDPKDVRKFLGILKKNGFSAAVIQDFGSRDRNKSTDTFAVFDPKNSLEFISKSRERPGHE